MKQAYPFPSAAAQGLSHLPTYLRFLIRPQLLIRS
jgi:hypothetical protein